MDVSWIVKLHYEAIQKNKFTHRSFPDMACEHVNACERWVDADTDAVAREQVKNEIEPVFS